MIIFDTETTGLLKAPGASLRVQPKIIELFALKCADEPELPVVDQISLLIHPGEQITEEIIRITGIKDEDLIGKPSFVQVFDQLCDFWRGQRIVVAHNLSFDIAMMELECRRISAVTRFPWCSQQICTVEKSMDITGRRMKLMALHEHLFGETFESAHRAENDVLALHRCVVRLIEQGKVKY